MTIHSEIIEWRKHMRECAEEEERRNEE